MTASGSEVCPDGAEKLDDMDDGMGACKVWVLICILYGLQIEA